MPETTPRTTSKVPTTLKAGTSLAVIGLTLSVVYSSGGLIWLPVLLIGAGTTFVATALTSNLPAKGGAWEWWCGRRNGVKESVKPVYLYVGIWLILVGTAVGAVVP